MKQILDLTEKDFLTGIAPSSQVQDKGLWHKLAGMTVVRDPFLASDEVGILQVSPEPVDLTGSIIQDTPFAWAMDHVDPDTGYGKLYIWGDDGYLYSIALEADSAPVNLNAALALGGMTDGANGLFVMNHSDGKKNVWYFRHAAIGYYGDLNGTPSFNNDEYTDDIEETPWHPVHQLFDRRYFGNGRYIGQLEDDGAGGLNVTGHALDFDTDDRVNCISDDGTYLVAGITKNVTTFPDSRGRSRIIFWDTNQSSWQREWEIPDANILSIRRVGSAMEAVTTRGVFAFNFSTPPQLVLPYFGTLGNTPEYTIPTQFAADVLGDALLFGGANRVSSFGKLTPAMPTAYFQPWAFGDDLDIATLVVASAKTSNIFVGTFFGKLYRISLATEGAGGTVAPAETIYIDLKRWYQVGRVVLGFDGQLQEDDEVIVTLKPDDLSSEFVAGTASFADNGPVRTKELFCTLEARKLKLLLNFADGAPRLRNIQVWGDPIETPTHSRADVGVPALS